MMHAGEGTGEDGTVKSTGWSSADEDGTVNEHGRTDLKTKVEPGTVAVRRGSTSSEFGYCRPMPGSSALRCSNPNLDPNPHP